MLRVTLDSASFDHKPDNREVGRITWRMNAAGSAELEASEFAQAVAHGHTWCGGCFEPKQERFGMGFMSFQAGALDFDNDIVVMGEDGKPKKDERGHALKRPLMPWEAGYIDPWQAFARFAGMFGGLYSALMLYPSFSFCFGGKVADLEDPSTRMKYRLVYLLAEPIVDEETAKKLLGKMLRAFPQADAKCANVNRLYFGGTRAVLVESEGVSYFGGVDS